jgi:hypothetical protein
LTSEHSKNILSFCEYDQDLSSLLLDDIPWILGLRSGDDILWFVGLRYGSEAGGGKGKGKGKGAPRKRVKTKRKKEKKIIKK